MELIDILEVFRDHLVEISILIFEFIGVGIIIVSGIHGFYLYWKRDPAYSDPAKLARDRNCCRNHCTSSCTYFFDPLGDPSGNERKEGTGMIQDIAPK